LDDCDRFKNGGRFPQAPQALLAAKHRASGFRPR